MGAPAAGPQATGPHNATFAVIVNGTRIGTETTSVVSTGAGWRISGTDQLAPPIDLVTNRFEVTYSAAWQPQQLTISQISRGQPMKLTATFTPTAAAVTVDHGGTTSSSQQPVSPGTLVMPQNTFSAYEALAMRLASASPGTRWPMYTATDREMSVRVDAITPRRLTAPTGAIDLRRCDVTFTEPDRSISAEVWIDADGHLARFILPGQAVAVVRDDLMAVMLRDEGATHPGDEQVYIPANGFSLAGTLSHPAGPVPRAPAVVLVGGNEQEDRDGTRAGVPILGELAGALADGGYVVVRYDHRGMGQSGGRTEGATMSVYADDLADVVEWLSKRKDVDPARLALVGYDDGGPLAMLTAGFKKSVRAVVLLASPGRPGRAVVLEQQQRALDQLKLSDADRAARVALETKILDAIGTGRGWETMPPEVRKASDTPWFRTWVLFQPSIAFRKMSQPVLIVHGALDTEVPPAHADALEQLATSRNGTSGKQVRKVILPGLNHLFVTAQTGSVSEYATLPSRDISPALAGTIATWLTEVLPPKK